MRELVEQIDAHAEPDDMEATNIPTVQDLLGESSRYPLTDQQEVTDPNRLSSWLFVASFFMLSLIFIAFSVYFLNGLFAYVTGMWWTNNFLYFAGLIGKQLPFFNFGFNSLNEFLSICVFRLDYANVLAINGMIPQNLLRGALDNPRVTMDLMFVKG